MCLLVVVILLALTRRGLAEMRFPFFSSSDNRGDGGGVAFCVRSLFWGESSARGARPPSFGPDTGGSAAGRNTPTPWAWRRRAEGVTRLVESLANLHLMSGWTVSYRWVDSRVLRGDAFGVHGWRGGHGVCLSVVGRGADPEGRADRHAGEALRRVLHRLTRCVTHTWGGVERSNFTSLHEEFRKLLH